MAIIGLEVIDLFSGDQRLIHCMCGSEAHEEHDGIEVESLIPVFLNLLNLLLPFDHNLVLRGLELALLAAKRLWGVWSLCSKISLLLGCLGFGLSSSRGIVGVDDSLANVVQSELSKGLVEISLTTGRKS